MKTFIIILLTSITTNVVVAQNNYGRFENIDKTIWQEFTFDIGNILKGVGYAYSRPLHWQRNDFFTLGGVAVGTIGLYVVDDKIRKEFLSHKEKIPKTILDYGWYAGSPQNNYGFTGAVYLTGLFTKNEKLRRTGVLLISSATATGFVQQLSKSLVGRARPGTNLGKNHFKPFGGSPSYRSFPSGHSVLTFTNAHVIAKQFKNKWVKLGIYAIGMTPGISRIYDDVHWASDIFLSWAMSYFIVEAIDIYLNKKYDEKYNPSKINKSSLNITFGGNRIGALYSF